jgi:helix-turn-helix protein
MTMPDWIPITEAARLMGISRSWAHQEVRNGRLAARYWALRWWVRPEEVERYQAALQRRRQRRERRTP